MGAVRADHLARTSRCWGRRDWVVERRWVDRVEVGVVGVKAGGGFPEGGEVELDVVVEVREERRLEREVKRFSAADSAAAISAACLPPSPLSWGTVERELEAMSAFCNLIRVLRRESKAIR